MEPTISGQLSEAALALALKVDEASNRIGPIAKGKTNPYYNNEYFDINDLLAAIRPILSSLQLSHQFIFEDLKLTLRVADLETGQFQESFKMLPDGPPQAVMSASTYYRRMLLNGMFDIEADDDDGNATSIQNTKPQPTPKQQPPKPKPDNQPWSYSKFIKWARANNTDTSPRNMVRLTLKWMKKHRPDLADSLRPMLTQQRILNDNGYPSNAITDQQHQFLDKLIREKENEHGNQHS